MKFILSIFTFLGLVMSAYSQCSLGSFSVNSPYNITTTSMTVSWGSSTGADDYQLQISSNGGSSYTNSGSRTTSTSRTVTGLTAGNTYVFRVYSYCDYSFYDPEIGAVIPITNIQLSSNTRSATTKPNAPSINSANSIASTSFTARWFTTNGATSYELDVSTCASFCSFVSGFSDKQISGGSTSSSSVTGLTPGVVYYYRVRAKTSGGTSSNSSSSNVETLASTPVSNSASSITQSSFQANWNSATGADDYRLYVSSNVLFLTHVSGYNGKVVTGTSSSVTGLTAGTTYYFRLRSANTDDDLSGYSTSQTVAIIPATPTVSAATSNSQTGFTANWSNVSGEDHYLLDVSQESNFNSFVVGYENLEVSGTNQVLTGLNSGETYYYRVRSENGGGISPYSGTASILLLPANPGALTITNITQSGFDLDWNAVTGSDEYLLDISEESDFNSYVSGYENKIINTTNESVSGLSSGVTYHMRLRSQNTSGQSGESEIESTTLIPSDPSILSASLINQNSFTANWTTETGADSYLLDVSQDSDFSTFITGYEQKSVSTSSETLTGLNSGETYFYRVSSQNMGGVSGLSGIEEAQLISADPGVLTVSSISQNGFSISWDAVVGAENYLLDISLDSEFATFISGYEEQEVTTNSDVVTGLESGITYHIRLRSKNSSGTSGYSDIKTSVTIPGNPMIEGATSIGQTNFIANWDEVNGVDHYLLDVSQDEDFSTFISGYEQQSINSNQESINGLNSGGVYYYRVVAQNTSGSSNYSETESVQLIPGNPGTISLANISQNGFDLSWNTIPGTDEYLLDISLSEDFSDFVSGYENMSVTSTSLTITDLNSGLEYFVKLSAKNITGESGDSDSESAIIIPANPISVDATEIDETEFKANWAGSTGAESYLIDISADEGFSSYVDGYESKEITTTSESIANLIGGDIYYYRVQAKNTSGTSDYSEIIEVQLASAIPEGLSANNIGQTSYELTWTSVNGGNTYLLDISLLEDFSSYLDGYESLETTTNEISIGDLEAGLAYYARLRSKNTTATSDYSETIQTILISADPANISTSNVSQQEFTISWDQSTGADQYLLDVSEAESFDTFLSGFEGLELTSTSSTITGLTPGQTYYFRLKSKNSSGESNYSEIINQLLISGDPTGLDVTDIQQTTISLNWENQLAASSYLVDLAYNESFTEFVHVNETTASASYEFSNLEEGQVYYTRVRSDNASGTSGYSSSISFQTIPSDPILTTETEVSQTSFMANWDPVFGADSYYLEVSQSSEFDVFLEGYDHVLTTETSMSITELSAGEVYFYRVSSGNNAGESGYSETKEILLIPSDPEIPVISEITQSSFEMSWNDIIGRDIFILDVSLSSTFEELLENYSSIEVDGLSQSITELQAGFTYYARIKSRNATGESDYSEVTQALLVPADPNVLDATSISQTSFTANWEEVEGQDSYILDVSESVDFSDFLTGYENLIVNNDSIQIDGLIEGGSYFYRVSSSNNSGESNHSSVIEVNLIPGKPGVQTYSEISQNSFTVSWDDRVGASSYLFDVSIDESFTNLIEENLLLNDTVITIENLEPGTTYYSRIRAQNETGISGYSAGGSTILVPANPISATGSAITQTEFAASWEVVTGVDSYLFDVSQQADFSVFMEGYNAKVVTGTSIDVSNLNPGETYYYRVRAENVNGTSGNSITREVLLIPNEVSAVTVSSHDYSSFDLDWEAVTGISSYMIDIATDSQFESVLEEYDQLTLTTTSTMITNLDAGQKYFIRIKAINSSGESDYTIINTETLPAIPENLRMVNRDFESFEVAWDASMGAVNFEIEVALDTDFNNMVDGYPELTGNTLNAFVVGLNEKTVYRVRLRSINSLGHFSEFTPFRNVQTTESDGSVTLPEISNVTASSTELNFTASSENGELKSVNLFHKKISDDEYSSAVAIDLNGDNQFKVDINPDWRDIFGWEYIIEVTDELDEITIIDEIDIIDPEDQILNVLSFGKKPENYQIISVPYELEGGSIEDILVPLMQGYDKTRWRLVRYQGEKNVDFTEGVGLQSFERGKSYWFISNEQIELNLGDGFAYQQADVKSTYRLSLNQGYNQIANPFPFQISWDELMQYNENPAAIDQYMTYNQNTQSLEESDEFLPYSGGFVYASENTIIDIPISLINGLEQSEGRVESDGRVEDVSDWELPINITQGTLVNKLTAIGMNQLATDGKDRFDLVTPPKFVSFSSLSTKVGNLSLSQDIVSQKDEYTWEFVLEHNQKGKPVRLDWNLELDGKLFLYVHESQQLIDMSTVDHIDIPANSRNVSIHFSRETPDHLMNLTQPTFGHAFPNPSNGPVQIPFNFEFNNSNSDATITIHDHVGNKVYSQSLNEMMTGVQEFKWNGENQVGEQVAAGIYYFTINFYSKGTQHRTKGKILIQH